MGLEHQRGIEQLLFGEPEVEVLVREHHAGGDGGGAAPQPTSEWDRVLQHIEFSLPQRIDALSAIKRYMWALCELAYLHKDI